MSNSFEAMAELDPTLRAVGLGTDIRPYYVMGNLVSSAVIDPNTKFVHDDRTVVMDDFPEPLVETSRAEAKPTAEILVLDRLSEYDREMITERANTTVDGKLGITVTGVEDHSIARSSLKLNLGSWASELTMDSRGVLRRELYPLSQVLPLESFEPYQLVLPDGESKVAMLNPAGHMLSYKMASIGGVHPKDAELVRAMEEKVYNDDYLYSQIALGSFAAWRRFAEGITSLGSYRRVEQTKGITDNHVTTAGLLAFALKSRGVAWLESRGAKAGQAQAETA